MKEMKKTYCKPETRYFLVSLYSMLMGSKIQAGGDNEEGQYGGELSRFGFWDDFDEDILEDIEDINDID